MKQIFKRISSVLVATLLALISCHRPPPQGFGAGVIPQNPVVGTLTAQQVSSPAFTMTQAASGAGQSTVLRSQAAATGSGLQGGSVFVTAGKSEDALNTDTVLFGSETVVGGSVPPTTNYFGALDLTWHQSNGVIIANFGRGNNGVGGGVNAIEISAFNPMSIATENNSPISFLPSSGTGAQSSFTVIATLGDNMPAMSFSNFGATYPASSSGILRMPWGESSNDQEILGQRTSANTDDRSILSRQSGALTYANLVENSNFCSLSTANVEILNSSGNGLTVSSPQNPTSNASFNVDSHSTWVEGDVWPCTHDCWAAQIYTADTASTSQSTIATIPITSGTQAVTQLHAKLEAREASTGDFASFTIDWSYVNNSGTIAAPSGSQPAWTDNGHSTGAGTSIAPAFSISGANILAKVTPWTTSAVHWRLRVEHDVDMGAAAAPTIPSGAVLSVNSTSISLGSVTTWTDQSGHGNNLVNAAAAKPVNTANAGPGGNTPAVVFTQGTWMAMKVLNALIGAKNFTVHLVVEVTSTSGQNVIVSSGDTTSGVTIGVGIDGSLSREIGLMGSNTILDGPATTTWEDWIVTSDASGNLSFWVNGAPRSISQQNATAITPSANFYVGSWTPSTGQLGGAVAEIDAWPAAQSPTAVYAYAHATWGL